jgi:hypothetical protein
MEITTGIDHQRRYDGNVSSGDEMDDGTMSTGVLAALSTLMLMHVMTLLVPGALGYGDQASVDHYV